MLRPVTAFIAGLLIPLWMAGCAAPRIQPAASRAPAVATEVVADPLTVVLPAPLPDAPVETNRPAPVPVPSASRPESNWPREWVNVWLPLESWGKWNGLQKPAQSGHGIDAEYLLQTTNGPMRLKAGSHLLRFGGHDFWLGFAPRLMKGFLYVHSIDARKTLQPLLGVPAAPSGPERIVVIDPGHGGKDSGAKSCFNGGYEKDYTLDWARRLAPLLRETGWTVVLTRTNDAYLSLTDRVAIADRVKADIFLSLHFNSGGGNAGLAGVETYCLTPKGMPSTLLRGEDDPREAHPNNAFDDENLHLATTLHRSLIKATGTADRGVGRARFMGVLRTQNRPAVLIEGGYLSNPQEARRIDAPEHRQALAVGVAQALE